MQQRPRLGVRAKRQAEIRIARTPLCPGSEKRTLRVILASNPELKLMSQIRQQSWRLMRDVPSSGCSPRTVAPSKGGSIPRPVSLGLGLSKHRFFPKVIVSQEPTLRFRDSDLAHVGHQRDNQAGSVGRDSPVSPSIGLLALRDLALSRRKLGKSPMIRDHFYSSFHRQPLYRCGARLKNSVETSVHSSGIPALRRPTK
jgi:hypothetical protein